MFRHRSRFHVLFPCTVSNVLFPCTVSMYCFHVLFQTVDYVCEVVFYMFQLSPTVTLGLHQIVQSVQQYDYNTGLGIYTQMVSQGNFSEISSFMPSLKMLIQSAAHLQVYVQ